MNEFKEWLKNNEAKVAVATRSELAELAFNGGIETTKEPQQLVFAGREIKSYQIKTELTLDSKKGFELDFNDCEGIDAVSLQLDLNDLHAIDIVAWIYASYQKPCVVEFSKGDVIDYSALANEEGASCECSRSFLAFVKHSLHFIEIIEVIEK